MLVISNPVNSTVPIFAEVLKKAGVFDPKKYGPCVIDRSCLTLQAVWCVASGHRPSIHLCGRGPRQARRRAQVLDPSCRWALGRDHSPSAEPVDACHRAFSLAWNERASLIDQSSDLLNNKEQRDALINRIQFGGDEVVKAKGWSWCLQNRPR